MDTTATYGCSNTACPMAHAALPEPAAAVMGFKCTVPGCGGSLVSPRAPSSNVSTAFPDGLAPAEMPTYLAHPWAALLTEDHPRIQLHWLVDTAELAVRWVVAVALAEVVYAHDGSLPESVAERIRDHIERPTLGRWLAILRELSSARPSEPLLAPGVFDLYESEIEHRFRQEKPEGTGGTLETSLLVLRNQIAHGGGMSKMRAQSLLDVQRPILKDLLRAVVAVTAEVQVIAVAGGRTRLMTGTEPRGCDRPEALAGAEEGPWLVGSTEALPLLPLARFGPVRHVDAHGVLQDRSSVPAAQVYARGGKDRISYTPLGRDEAHSEEIDVQAWRALFRLDAERPARKTSATSDGFVWDDFLREARGVAENLVGRVDELKTIKVWLKSRKPREDEQARLGWISGSPGVGKSMVMARLASDYSNAPPSQKGLFYHRFRGGDSRNNRRSFLRLLQAALWAWEPLAEVTEAPSDEVLDGQELLDDVVRRLEAVEGLEACHPKAPAPSFLVLVDGLDEVVGSDRNLPALLRELAVPGTVWVLAGRSEHGLDDAFAVDDCDTLFQKGLPPMREGDVRAMLLEGLGSARYALLKLDKGDDEEVRNAFIERVTERARGLPLYVHLLLKDLRAGRLSVHDADKLPDTLSAYYDDLVERLGVSTAKADLTLIVALLARAQEPLDANGLAVLLARGVSRVDRYLPRVEAALRVGQVLLRRASSADTDDAWTLYHQSFREYVAGRPATDEKPAVPAAAALRGSIQDAEDLLFDLASSWTDLADPRWHALRNHLFCWGTEYALWWHGAEGVAAVHERLTDFAYLQARTGALPAWEITDLAGEYEAVLAKLGDSEDREDFRMWEAFFRERAHLLRRGDDEWPANRILLQLAVEHADDSPVTRAAEKWLDGANCDWHWLRRARRPLRAEPSACLRVLEGHDDAVLGAAALEDGRFISWSSDGTLRVWESNGIQRAVLEGHEAGVAGAEPLPGGRVLSWDEHGVIHVWDQKGEILAAFTAPLSGDSTDLYIPSWEDMARQSWNGAGLLPKTLAGPAGVTCACALQDGGILSWGKEALHLWDDDGTLRATLAGHGAEVEGAAVLPDESILSWSRDGSLRLWDAGGRLQVTLRGHSAAVTGAEILPHQRILSWSEDSTLRLWDTAGSAVAILEGHCSAVRGAKRLADGRILSWSDDGTLRVWDGSGRAMATLTGHTGPVVGAQIIDDQRFLSWSQDRTLRLWAVGGTAVGGVLGHGSKVDGATPLACGRILSWSSGSEGGTFRLWDDEGTLLSIVEGHAHHVVGITLMPDGSVLSFSYDGQLKLWDFGNEPRATTHDSQVRNCGVTILQDGRVLGCFLDSTLRLWSADGEPLGVFDWSWTEGKRTFPRVHAAASRAANARLTAERDGNRAISQGRAVCLGSAVWHSDQRSAPRVLNDDGSVVVSLENGPIWLQLWLGASRVKLDGSPVDAPTTAPGSVPALADLERSLQGHLSCPECSKRLKTKRGLAQHLRSKHG